MHCAATCRDCPLVRACGGGLYAHRYKSANGFDNPSVYCDDLKILIPQLSAARWPALPAAAGADGTASGSSFLPEGAFDLLAAGPGDSRRDGLAGRFTLVRDPRPGRRRGIQLWTVRAAISAGRPPRDGCCWPSWTPSGLKRSAKS